MCDAAVTAYYNEKGTNYAKFEVHVNGIVPPGTFHVSFAEDGMSVTWQQAVIWRCFLKEHLCGVMQDKFSQSHSSIVAHCNVVQEMKRNKMTANAGSL